MSLENSNTDQVVVNCGRCNEPITLREIKLILRGKGYCESCKEILSE